MQMCLSENRSGLTVCYVKNLLLFTLYANIGWPELYKDSVVTQQDFIHKTLSCGDVLYSNILNSNWWKR